MRIMQHLSERLHLLEHHIAEMRAQSPLASAHVTLVAVSKGQSQESIRHLLAAGHRDFGENRVQEALEKWPSLKAEFPDIRLRLIGPLQTNKVREAVDLFDAIDTVDRPKLAEALAHEFARRGDTRPCMIQINTGEEPQKAGASPAEADALIRVCRIEWNLSVTGLMCVPPVDDLPSPHFALLRKIAKRHSLPELSMGMSSDMEEAIRFGATHVRIGTALFGVRC